MFEDLQGRRTWQISFWKASNSVDPKGNWCRIRELPGDRIQTDVRRHSTKPELTRDILGVLSALESV
jgi:hypothetical protein